MNGVEFVELKPKQPSIELREVSWLKRQRAELARLFAKDKDMRSLPQAVFRILSGGDPDYINKDNPTKAEDVERFVMDAMDAKIEQAWLSYQLAVRRDAEPALDKETTRLWELRAKAVQ
jgi:hypothetical protein